MVTLYVYIVEALVVCSVCLISHTLLFDDFVCPLL